MTAANIDLVRGIYESWERGDFSRTSEWARPEIECVSFGGPITGAYTGPVAIDEGWRALLDTVDDARPTAQEYRDVDEERILVLGCLRGRGRAAVGGAAAREPVPHLRRQGREADLLLGSRTRICGPWPLAGRGGLLGPTSVSADVSASGLVQSARGSQASRCPR